MSDRFALTPTQQAAAISRARENIALTSGAGCGKTFVLARRLTELLMTESGEDSPLSRFVALTFTDKAALEMLDRVRKLLGDFATAATSPEDRRRLLGWLQELPEARICTIHSFCAALLRAHAVEAGVDPNFTVCADTLTAGRMAQDAADEAILQAVEAGDPATAEALARLPYYRLAEDVARLLDDRTAWQDTDYADPAATMRRWEQLAKTQDADEQVGPLDAQAATLLATLTTLAGRAETIYAAAKRRAGLLDFTDLLAATRLLLENSPAVRKALGEQVSQLLVDEAQDTDAFQIALLELLVFGSAGGDELPAGRLFLVGDAKQSIYRFRGARVETFRDLCRRIGPGQQENLDRSFRTHTAGVEFVNHVFSQIMADYEPIVAHRSDLPEGASVELLLARGEGDAPAGNAAEASAAQAAVTAQRIAEMVSGGERIVRDGDGGWRPARYGDVAILFTRMTESLEYERELSLRGVPYYVVGGTGFFKQQEVYDVLNALRAIENPYDDVALFGLLRGAMVGLDDNALMRLAEAIAPPYLPALTAMTPETLDGEAALRVGGLSDGDARTLAAAVRMIERLHRRKDAVSVDRLIEELLAETGYEATVAAQFQGAQRLGNVRRLVERGRAAAEGGATLSEFIAQANELVISESRHEQAAVAGEAEDVVRLMTVHKAKGLEFPVVFVPDLNARQEGTREALLHRGDWGLTYKLKADEEEAGDDKAATPLSYRLAKEAEDADRAAERIRLLYVATTRHEDHLVLVAGDWRTKKGDLWNSGSYARLLDETLGITDAIESRDGMIPYAGGKFSAVARRVAAKAPARQRRSQSAGEKMLHQANDADALAAGIIKLAGKAEPDAMLGPLPADIGRVELATTAMVDFDHCPMLYRWRYDLRVPVARPAARGQTTANTGLDAATLGTLYHRCMELLDLSDPQPAAALVAHAAAEMELGEAANLAAITADLEAMLGKFLSDPLAKRLATAQHLYRELDFVLDVGPATLRGQIDLLYQDAEGAWRIVDYKSDRVSEADMAERAARYELQMLVYAAAVAAHTGQPPADATLYFLRLGAGHVMPIDATALAGARQRAEALARKLIAARRAGHFAFQHSPQCEYCMYGELCGRITD